MFIKEILTYDGYYAEYIVSDGYFNLRCMCTSVPLSFGRKPEIGMEVLTISAFSFRGIETKQAIDETYMIEKRKHFFEYLLRGKIVDSKRALIAVGDMIINLGRYCGLI